MIHTQTTHRRSPNAWTSPILPVAGLVTVQLPAQTGRTAAPPHPNIPVAGPVTVQFATKRATVDPRCLIRRRWTSWLGIALAIVAASAISVNAQESTSRSIPRVASESKVNGIYGGILPAKKIDISTKQEGVIARVTVKPGEVVSKGQVVAEMDAQRLLIRQNLAKQELHKANAVVDDRSAITTAKAQFARSEATYNTMVKLDHKAPLEIFRSQMEMREKQAALDFALAKHAQDVIDAAIKSHQLDAARLDVESCQVRSPISGVVSEQAKHAGEYVRAGEKLLTVVQMNQLIFRVEFSSEHLPPNRLADYRVDATFDVASNGQSPIYVWTESSRITSTADITTRSHRSKTSRPAIGTAGCTGC